MHGGVDPWITRLDDGCYHCVTFSRNANVIARHHVDLRKAWGCALLHCWLV
jgi:hypothetical protein